MMHRRCVSSVRHVALFRDVPWARSISAHGSRASKIPALLTGRGRFVDDIKLARHAARLLRAQPARRTPASAAIDTSAARAMPGVHAVLTADDMPPRMRDRANPDAGAQSGDQDAAHPACAGARRGLLRRPDRRGGDRRQTAISPKTPRRPVVVDYELLPAVSDCRDAVKPDAPRRAQRPHQQRRGLRADELRRRRCGVRERAARVRGRAAAASRRRHDAGRPRRAGEPRRGGRHAHRLVGDADAASRRGTLADLFERDLELDPRDRAASSAAASAPRRRSMPRRR